MKKAIPPKEGKKLLVPFNVSTNLYGFAQRGGTKAFVEKGTRVNPKKMRKLRAAINRFADDVTPREEIAEFKKLEKAMGVVAAQRYKIAQHSDFFIKPINSGTERMRVALLKAGVNVEVPIQNLKNGTALFARGGYKQLKIGEKPNQIIIDQIIDIVARVHSCGIVHGHMHGGNFVANRSGKVRLIDLSLARWYAKKPKTKTEYLKRFGKEISAASTTIFYLSKGNHKIPLKDRLEPMLKIAMRIIESGGNPYKITVDDFTNYLSSLSRKEIEGGFF